MESQAVKLAKKIFTILKDEAYEDSVSALKIAKIMIPTPAARRKAEKQTESAKDEADSQEESAGALVPADQDLMRFSKAMGRTVAAPSEVEEEPEMQ